MAHSHSLNGTGCHPTTATSTLLALLTGVLTVPCGGSLDFAIALDSFDQIVDGAIADLTDLADLVTGASAVHASRRPRI